MTILMTLWKELGRMTLASFFIYAGLFGILWGVEILWPELQGVLLQWDNLSWVVGIPASFLGTAYVLTIRNPQNYTGFYMGIVMSLLFALQCYLQGKWDLPVLYVVVFVPFQLKSLLTWRKQTGNTLPAFLPGGKALLAAGVFACICVLDYLWAHSWISAIMVASSVMANFLMIYKKNEAWICWIIYCVAGLVLFVLLGNVFTVVLFVTMTLVNLSGQIAWWKMTRPEDMGWLR